jgi:hypothetical protein
MAGNGTIGLELLDDLPELDAVLVPYGGGGLVAGIAAAVKTLSPRTKVYACEVDTAASEAGERTNVEYHASFVDGISSPFVLEDMWPLVRSLVDGSIVVTLAEVASAVRTLAERHHVIAEGAGAVSVAAALTGRAGAGRVACVVSGEPRPGEVGRDPRGKRALTGLSGGSGSRGREISCVPSPSCRYCGCLGSHVDVAAFRSARASWRFFCSWRTGSRPRARSTRPGVAIAR